MAYLDRNKLSLITGIMYVFASFASPCAEMAATQETSTQPSSAGESQKQKEKDFSFGNYLSGKFAESSGDSDKSIRFLQDSLVRDPDNKELLLGLYHELLAAGRVEESAVVAKKLSGSKWFEDGTEFPPELIAALAEAKSGNSSEAARQLKTVPKTGFNSILLPLLDAWLASADGDLKTPLRAKDIMPGGKVVLSHVTLNAAFINDMAGFDREARAQYEEAAQETRLDTSRIAEALVNYYDRKGDKEQRQAFVKAYTDHHGETLISNLTVPEKPVMLVANAREGLAEALYTVSSIFHGVRSPADEITTLQLALYLRPDFPAARYLLANSYDLKKSYSQAIDSYQQIAPESPYYLQSRIMIAYDNSETGNNEAAFAILDRIIADRPDRVLALLAKGDILRVHGDYTAALAVYDEAVKRLMGQRKSDWLVYFSRGICYERTDQIEKAEKDMQKALDLSPGNPDILNYLGYTWLERGKNLKEARRMVEQAYDARPEDPQIIDSMGYALYREGDYASAQEYFERALERTPDEPAVNEHLGDTYYKLGRKTEAKYQWQRALDNKPEEKNRQELLKKMESGLEGTVVR